MNITYLNFILFLLTVSHISKTMQVDLSTIITFNGKEKSLYEWIRDDRNKTFGRTPVYDMNYKNEKDHYSKVNSVKTLTDNQLKGITKGAYIYCKNFKIKTINSKKQISYGALAALKAWPNVMIMDTSSSSKQWTSITPELIKSQSNLLYADYLKKSFDKEKKTKTDKIITNKSII